MTNICPIGGKHIIIDLFECKSELLANTKEIENVLKLACEDAGATVLFSNFYHFGGQYGVTGVIGLSESHCSIHTWPEEKYISLDFYMCGNCDPMNSIPRILDFFRAESSTICQILRGSSPFVIQSYTSDYKK